MIHDYKYGYRVPIHIGTRVIDKAMRLIMKEDLDRATDSWKHTHVSMALEKTNQVSTDGFQLEKVKRKVTVDKPSHSPFETVEIKGKNQN